MDTATERINTAPHRHSVLGGHGTAASPCSPQGAGVPNIVVMGEINKGKSCFINALLGTPGLLPSSDTATTTTVFKIRHGNKIGYTVHYLPNDRGQTPAPQPIDAANATALGAALGPALNSDTIDYIAVTAPAPLLATGLELTDTPGFGSVVPHNTTNIWRHVPGATAIIFVTSSSDAPIGSAEQQCLLRAYAITPNIIFIQTKKDLQDRTALQRRQANNQAIIAATLDIPADSAAYFCVSAHLKLACDQGTYPPAILPHSGFPQVTDFLQNTLTTAS